MEDEDGNARKDEIEALCSIYPGDIELKEDEMVPTLEGDWKLHKQRGAIIKIYPREDSNLYQSASSYTVQLDVSTPFNYPSKSAPSYTYVCN